MGKDGLDHDPGKKKALAPFQIQGENLVRILQKKQNSKAYIKKK